MQVMETDVLVIGGGAAAAAAALAAARSGVSVALVDKGRFGYSGATPMSTAAISVCFSRGEAAPQASEEPADSADCFVDDVVRNGCHLSDVELVRAMVTDSEDVILEASRLGLPLMLHPDGSIAVKRAQGHGFPRLCQVVGGGPVLGKSLSREARRRGVVVLERTAVARLTAMDGQLAGAVALDLSSGEWVAIRCKAAVLAAGGAAALYRYASTNHRTAGDAFTLALDAGALLANMEFVEFTLIPVVRGRVVSMGGFGQLVIWGAQLRNRDGERFMARYDPTRMEFSTKCLLSRAVYEEIAKGRGPIYMDLSAIAGERWEELRRESPQMVSRLERPGWLEPGVLCWTPAAHFNLGGIVIDSQGRTSVPGLLAAGECTNGVHGAERLAGNALLECLVFGRRAGRSAAQVALSPESRPWDGRWAREEISHLSSRIGSTSSRGELAELRDGLQQAAWEGLGLARDEGGLANCRSRLNEIGDQLQRLSVADQGEMIDWLELRNLSTVGGLVAEAAALRTESRGAHQRRDFPDQDDRNWRRWIVAGGRDGKPPLELSCP